MAYIDKSKKCLVVWELKGLRANAFYVIFFKALLSSSSHQILLKHPLSYLLAPQAFDLF